MVGAGIGSPLNSFPPSNGGVGLWEKEKIVYESTADIPASREMNRLDYIPPNCNHHLLAKERPKNLR